MSDEQLSQDWIERCARRLQTRFPVELPEARELAAELHGSMQGHACPERVAEEMFSIHA